MRVWSCYCVAALLALVSLLVFPECVRDARRIFRLSHGEGLRLVAEITRIEEEDISNTEESGRIAEVATVRYFVGGKEYRVRHLLPDVGRHHLGDRIEIVALPDEPGHSYSPYTLTGDWIMALMLPAMLLLGAVTFGYAGFLLAGTAVPDRRKPRRK